MPESRESNAHLQMLKNILGNLQASRTDFHLCGIWVDGTEKEQNRAPVGSWLRDGHVYKLQPDSKIVWGLRKHQTRVFPPMYTPPFGFYCIFQNGIKSNVLHHIQYLTHTSVQIYSRSQWENSVCEVDKDVWHCLPYFLSVNIDAHHRRGVLRLEWHLSLQNMLLLSQPLTWCFKYQYFVQSIRITLLIDSLWQPT